MSESGVVAFELVVRGLVQGVFFRDSCRGEADVLGVAGWVRNEPDGTVRIHVEGSPDAVERLVGWAHRGPRHAVVESVEVTPAEPAGVTGFRVR